MVLGSVNMNEQKKNVIQTQGTSQDIPPKPKTSLIAIAASVCLLLMFFCMYLGDTEPGRVFEIISAVFFFGCIILGLIGCIAIKISQKSLKGYIYL